VISVGNDNFSVAHVPHQQKRGQFFAGSDFDAILFYVGIADAEQRQASRPENILGLVLDDQRGLERCHKTLAVLLVVNEAQVGKRGGIIMLFGFVQPSNIRSFHGLTLRALEKFVQNSLRGKSKWKVFRADFLVVAMQGGDAAFRSEFRLARIAWVEKQNSANRLAKTLVSVAENDRVRFFSCDSCL